MHIYVILQGMMREPTKREYNLHHRRLVSASFFERGHSHVPLLHDFIKTWRCIPPSGRMLCICSALCGLHAVIDTNWSCDPLNQLQKQGDGRQTPCTR